MTPTAGGVVFFGDMGGNFYALDADDGHKLWGQKIGGAIGGGVITYKTGNGATRRRRHGIDRSAVADGNHDGKSLHSRSGRAGAISRAASAGWVRSPQCPRSKRARNIIISRRPCR